ncbi:hypothetical protein ACW2Q0_16325 [Nocardia sp. R16R-3T]
MTDSIAEVTGRHRKSDEPTADESSTVDQPRRPARLVALDILRRTAIVGFRPRRARLRGRHAIYIGPGMALGAHSTAIASVGVGLDGAFRVRVPDAAEIRIPRHQWRTPYRLTYTSK